MAFHPLKSDSLEAVSTQNYTGTSNAGAERERLIQSILKHAQDKQWRKVLEVSSTSDERQVQRQFRKLAKLVHPDKCDVEGAEAAFKAICLAAAELSSAMKGATVAEEGDVYWWEAWEDDAVEKKRKRAESPSLDAEDAVWQTGLHEMSVEELREEVTQLQASVFSKSTTSSDIQIPVHRKQQRLRRARSFLSRRLEESAKKACCDGPRMAGGFL
ncbi:g212 [Coccomyxa elongata]